MGRYIKDRTGEVIINSDEDVKKKGWRKMEIVAYRSVVDIDVLIDDKYLITGVWYRAFIRRAIKNPYHRGVYGIGYIGEGTYKASGRGVHAQHYNTWRYMLMRCYEAYQESHPWYKGCTVSDEWCNYQAYAAWYDENYYEVGDEPISINKSILFKGNKLFSKDTCIFAPKRINDLLRNKGKLNKELPKGVSLQRYNGKFRACYAEKHISVFDTQEEAFHAFKTTKENKIKEVIDSYCGKIPEPHYTKIRDALYAYEVCIDD